MKIALFVCCVLFSLSLPGHRALAGGDDFDIVQLNIYGGNVQPPMDQPHGVSISDEGTVNTFGPGMNSHLGKTTNKRRKALLTDVLSIYPGSLVDQDPGAPECADQATMDYNITKSEGGDTITLIHYFHCHTFIALGGLPPDQATIVLQTALRIKTVLDGVLAYSQFGSN